MHAGQNPPGKFDRLRRQAEELIQGSPQQAVPPPDDILELIHELNVHQIELEIQNEELKRAQHELSDLYHQYEQLYELAPCGYVTLDPHGVINRINQTAVSLLDTPKKNLLKTALSKYIASAWQVPFLEARQNAAFTGERQQIEVPLKRKNGPALWLRADITAERDEREAVVQWRVVLIDITREKATEAQIYNLNKTLENRVAERTNQLQQLALDLTRAEDRERRSLAAILHDDFQQQTAYFKMVIDRLARQADTDIRRELEQLSQSTSDYIEKMRHLAYSLNPPVLQSGSLLAALDSLAKEMQTLYGLTVFLRLQAGAEPTSTAIASILYRSVRELLYNVVKHAEVNSAIVEVGCQDERIRIKVIDEGKGFDYPVIRNGKGCKPGFGLYSIEDRMVFLSGSMQVATQPGKGCCVVLTIPIDIASTSTTPVKTTKTAARKGSAEPEKDKLVKAPDCNKQIRILLVDDHRLMRKGLAELLQGREDIVIVDEATNGLEAVELADRLRPHVILMDVTMPKMDGDEATARITSNHPDIRIIGLSMHNDDFTRQKMLDAGAVAFLAKTDSPDKLFKTIHRVCRGSRRTKQTVGER